MGEPSLTTSNSLKWSSFIALLAVALFCSAPILSCLSMPKPEATAKEFKVGTRLTELGAQIKGWTPDSIEVFEWVSASQSKTLNQNEYVRKTEFGEVKVTPLGKFEDWVEVLRLGDSFTGMLVLFHYSWVIPDDAAPSFIIELTYIDGTLRKIDWGIIPG